MHIAILQIYCGASGQFGSYNCQEVGLAKAFAALGHRCTVAYPDTMAEAAEEWKNTAADTFYGRSDGLSAFGMRTSGSRPSSIVFLWPFEYMMRAIASGSFSRSIRGDRVSSIARRHIFVMRRMMVSSIASNSSEDAKPPIMSFSL